MNEGHLEKYAKTYIYCSQVCHMTYLESGWIMLINEIIMDIKAAKKKDPAARSYAEILFLYQGVHAMITYRVAHWLYVRKHFFLARWISQHSRKKTLIEIHPGATLGNGIFIDHGAGVVIGETAEVGDNCLIYQCVTLGGTGKDTGKRHPTLGKNVMVGAGAQVLGPIYIGDNCKVASNAVVLKSVPAGTTVAGIPAKAVKKKNTASKAV